MDRKTETAVRQFDAAQAYRKMHAETRRRMELLRVAVEEQDRAFSADWRTPMGPAEKERLHWGHVGTLEEINRKLASALHYAGVAEFVEE